MLLVDVHYAGSPLQVCFFTDIIGFVKETGPISWPRRVLVSRRKMGVEKPTLKKVDLLPLRKR
jgi:hypothetical protein